MTKGIAAFDFCTSGDMRDICAAYVQTPEGEQIWPKKKEGATYALKLSPVDLVQVYHALQQASEEHTLVGWSTLGYDLRLLYNESVIKDEVVNLALSHVDLMFQIYSDYGDMVSLASIKESVPSIDKNLSPKVPQLWRGGLSDQNQVLHHMIASTERVKGIASTLLEGRAISWWSYKDTSANSNGISYANSLVPCMNYCIPAMMLPEKVFQEKWRNTFSWITKAAREKLEKEPTAQLNSDGSQTKLKTKFTLDAIRVLQGYTLQNA